MSCLPSQMPHLRPGSERTERIDRFAWTVGMCFDAFDVRIGVRSNEPLLLERLEPCLPPGWTPVASPVVDQLFSLWVDDGRGPGRRLHRVYAGRASRLRTPDLGQALDVLESEIRQCVAARAPERVFVHAGVVGWRGRAILIPGRSRSGKTTLVAELVKEGASYFSDEFAVLDRQGHVHPFAKPLSIREGPCEVHEIVRRRHPGELGGRSAPGALPVGLVALTAHRAGAGWGPSWLTCGEAVLEMLAHTVPARLRPEACLEALGAVAARARVFRCERGEAWEAARALLGMLEETERSPCRETGEEEMR